MRPVSQWTLDDLNRLLTDEVPESLTLDYKASETLKKSDGGKKELAKDVSSFANSAGGRIIIGMMEHDNKPAGLDGGVDETEWSRESIEQTIDTNVTPRIVGLHIHPISLGNGRTYYVIDIPQAIVNAPHQVKRDKKYHKRLNFTTTEMEDYEIRDAMRRSSYPNLYMDMRLVRQEMRPANQADIVELEVITRNESDQPTNFVMLTVSLPAKSTSANFSQADQWRKGAVLETDFSSGIQPYQTYIKQINASNNAPLFREQRFEHGRITIEIHGDITRLHLATKISCPGCLRVQAGYIERTDGAYTLIMSEPIPE